MQRPGPLLSTTDPDEFAAAVAPVAGPMRVIAHRGFCAGVRLTRLPHVGLMQVHVRNTRIVSEKRDYDGVTIPLVGRMRIEDEGGRGDFAAGEAHVSPADDLFDLRARGSLSTLVATFDPRLVARVATRVGAPLRPRMSLNSPEGTRFWRLLGFLWAEADRGSGLAFPDLAERKLEEALTAELVTASASPERSEREAPDALRRAEEFLMANLDRPLSVADLAEAAGVSVRSLYRAFHGKYGQPPMAVRAERRLDAAHRALLAADPTAKTVTEIAFGLGFFHLGRFATRYRAHFGETPSETLRR